MKAPQIANFTKLPKIACAATAMMLTGISHAQSFFSLGVPDGGAGSGWSANSISNDGSVVTMVSMNLNYQGAYWQNGVVSWLARQPNPYTARPHYSQPVVSADGRYIVYQDHQTFPNTLVRYDLSTGERLPTGLAVSGAAVRWFGVSGDGSRIVGAAANGSDRYAAVWTNGVIQLSPYSLFNSDTFQGISENGQNIVGRFQHPVNGPAFVRMVGDSFDAFYATSFWDSAHRISNDGAKFLGTTYVGGAFVWSDALGDIMRPTLPPTFTSATGLDMTADGRYVVGSLFGTPGSVGMIWDTETGSVRTLAEYLGYAPAGWTITSIDAISANGLYLAGTGLFDGQQLAWAFAPSAIPEPSTYAALAGLSALGLVFWRRRNANHKNQAKAS